MNERTITDAFRKFVRDEDISDSLWEFNQWIDKVASQSMRDVVESIGTQEFYEAYLP